MKTIKELSTELMEIKNKIEELGRFFEIEAKEKKISELEEEASLPKFWEMNLNAQKVMSELALNKEIVARWKGLKENREDCFAHIELLEEAQKNPNFLKSDQPFQTDHELEEIEKNLKNLDSKFYSLNLESKLNGENDLSNAIVSLHSGAGGTEACDWTEMLLRMYKRWAESKGFSTEIIDILPGEEAGIKSITFLIQGRYAYGYIKSEIGVHRLVRISPFDANKRRHTSFASCDVIPEIQDEIKVEINEADLKIDTYRASGHGGQHVNKTDSAVRITHLPSGLVVACQIERSQLKNKLMAMKLLRAKLYELEQEKRRAALEKHYDDKGDISWGNQIRSYVFMPYQLVKDLRTGMETGQVQKVMDGEIDLFIHAYLSLKEKK
ncbi:MAG: peptide chain release factor 2 [Elusimicrobia bacterium]|nr:peptide chain release factor 2 [Elusimicrobiota bacterium]